MVRFVLQSRSSTYPISLPFMPQHELTANRIMGEVQSILQSNEDMNLEDGMHVAFGLGDLFRRLVRTASPFLKTTAKKVGKRLLQTGLDTGMQIIGDVVNGQSLKKSVTTRAKTAGKDLVAGTLET